MVLFLYLQSQSELMHGDHIKQHRWFSDAWDQCICGLSCSGIELSSCYRWQHVAVPGRCCITTYLQPHG